MRLCRARLCEMHTGREQYSRSIQSEVGCGYQRGATFVVPHIFPLDEGAPDTQHGRDEVGSALSALDFRCSARPLGRCFAKRRCTVAVSAPYLLKEHPGGKSIKRKLSPKGGDPPQKFGRNRQMRRAISCGACDVPWSPTCEAVKGVTVVLTLLPIRWQSSTLAGEP